MSWRENATNSFGKNEMWYVVSADKGAKLISGFSEQITPKEYKERVYNGTFAEVLQTCDVKPGDVFYVPAGRVHGIGAGAFVAEIQQTSDITYRIFDYNRKDKEGKSRELHTTQATEAINFADVQDDFRTEYDHLKNEPVELVASPYFTTSLYDMTEEITCDYSELVHLCFYLCGRQLAVSRTTARMRLLCVQVKRYCCLRLRKKLRLFRKTVA